MHTAIEVRHSPGWVAVVRFLVVLTAFVYIAIEVGWIPAEFANANIVDWTHLALATAGMVYVGLFLAFTKNRIYNYYDSSAAIKRARRDSALNLLLPIPLIAALLVIFMKPFESSNGQLAQLAPHVAGAVVIAVALLQLRLDLRLAAFVAANPTR